VMDLSASDFTLFIDLFGLKLIRSRSVDCRRRSRVGC
jgi:hypothetical protein